jgi:hypothetical protein
VLQAARENRSHCIRVCQENIENSNLSDPDNNKVKVLRIVGFGIFSQSSPIGHPSQSIIACEIDRNRSLNKPLHQTTKAHNRKMNTEHPDIAPTVSDESVATSSSNFNGVVEVFEAGGFSPPEKARDYPIESVEDLARNLLRKQFKDLTMQQQVMFSYLVMNNQHALLRDALAVGAIDVEEGDQTLSPLALVERMLSYAMNPQHSFGKRLHAIIRKGGDIDVPKDPEIMRGDNSSSPFEMFLNRQENECWRTDPACFVTIFNNPNSSRRIPMPLIWKQGSESTVCYLTSSSCALFYHQCMKKREASREEVYDDVEDEMDDAMGEFAVNVCKFMRDAFTEGEIFANVFQGRGGSPLKMLRRMLEEQNANVTDSVANRLTLHLHRSANSVFEAVEDALRVHGALIMENFISFPALNTDDHRTTFGGHWKDYHSDPNVDPRPFLHALLIVGVGKVDDSRMGGVVFLLQNSYQHKTFVVVGLDLLRSMEVKSVVAIDERVRFDSGQFRHESQFPTESTSTRKTSRNFFEPIDLHKVSHKEI